MMQGREMANLCPEGQFRNPMTTIHRIYTEKKNEREILRLASSSFKSFTVQPTAGYFRGKREPSVVLEIIGARQRAVDELAESIRRMNGQKSVLILKTNGTAKVTRNHDSRRNRIFTHK